MKTNDYRQQDLTQLKDLLLQKKRELFNLRLQRVNGQLGSTASLKKNRREVARIYTIMNEKFRSSDLRSH